MKYVKMLGLAAVAAAALMAFVGASSASATVLCKTEGTGTPTGTTCPANQAYPAGTEVHAVLDPGTGKAVLTTSFLNIECAKSTVSGKTSNEGSATETVKGNVETLTFEECNCPVTVIEKGSLEIHWIEGTHNGTLTSSGAVVTAECSTIFGKVHCIYKTGSTDLGTLTGSKTTEGKPTDPATMDIESKDIPRTPTNGLCDETANWDAKYEVTSPNPLWITGHT